LLLAQALAGEIDPVGVVDEQADQLAVELTAEASKDPSNAVNDDRAVLRVAWKRRQ
jgi:hypothetical protein